MEQNMEGEDGGTVDKSVTRMFEIMYLISSGGYVHDCPSHG